MLSGEWVPLFLRSWLLMTAGAVVRVMLLGGGMAVRIGVVREPALMRLQRCLEYLAAQRQPRGPT
jgi:hypothetical protein